MRNNNYIMKTENLKKAIIDEGGHKTGLSKHIHLQSNGNTFILSWDSPIKDAWLVMVDECILRIDYKYEGYQYNECCFPKGYNYEQFLKCGKWNSAKITSTEQKQIYNFN